MAAKEGSGKVELGIARCSPVVVVFLVNFQSGCGGGGPGAHAGLAGILQRQCRLGELSKSVVIAGLEVGSVLFGGEIKINVGF